MGRQGQAVARGISQGPGATCVVLIVSFAWALLAPGTVAAQTSETVSAEFTVPASDGYTLDVKSERGQVTVTVARERPPVATISTAGQLLPASEGSVAAATYRSQDTGQAGTIEADLGPFGHIEAAFQPSGERRITHLSQKGKTTGCVFPRRIVRNLGNFTGTISFRGENGYTSVDATSAAGSLGTSSFRNCSTRKPAPREVIVGQAGPDAFLSVFDGAGRFLSASTLGPGAGFYASSVELLAGGLSVVRTAEAHATGALDLDVARHVLTVRPPPPFSGSATFRRHHGAPSKWSGSLAVAFPGQTISLIGPSFEAQLRLDE